MENRNSKRKMSFEELRRRRLSQADPDGNAGDKLFETDWEVFVGRYNAETGKYDNRTFCCEDAVG